MTNIVMVVRDRFRLTEQALKSLFDHTDRDQFNLTIVDDYSTDFRLLNLMSRYCRYPNVTCVHIEKSQHVIARAKNIGVEWSDQTFDRHQWLYISDNDVCFTPGWLDTLTGVAVNTIIDGYKLWGGQVHPFHKPTRPHCLLSDCKLDQHQVVDGPSWLMRWDTWDAYGPFDPNNAPGPCQSDEYPFCKKILDDGHLIGVVKPHVVIHTGLTQTDGRDAPGRAEREATKVPGVLYQ